MSLQAVDGLEEKTHLLVQPISRFPERPPFRDVAFLVSYLLHYGLLVAVIVYGALLPPVVYGAPSNEFWLVAWLGSLHGRHLVFAVLLLFICSLIGVLWSLFTVALIRTSAVAVVWASAIFSVCLTLAWCIYAFYAQVWWMGALLLVLTVLNVLFLFVVYRRIPFTAQLLATVAHVAKQYPGLIVQSLVTLVAWFCYLILWSLACLYSSRIQVLQGWQLVPMLLFLFWSQQVSSNPSPGAQVTPLLFFRCFKTFLTQWPRGLWALGTLLSRRPSRRRQERRCGRARRVWAPSALAASLLA